MAYPINTVGLCAILLFAHQTRGQAEEDDTSPAAPLPDTEFLEFLGSFETDNGDWVNPNELMEAEFEQLIEAAQSGQLRSPDFEETESRTGSDNINETDEN